MVRTLTEVELDARGLLTIGDWSYASKNSPVDWHRRLGSNESASSAISQSGVDRQQVIIKIGEIVAYIMSAVVILVIIFSRFISWNTVNDEDYLSQGSLRRQSSIYCSESIVIPPLDEEEIRDVLLEYERLTAQLQANRIEDFTHCKSNGMNFKNTTTVVTPFVRKSSRLPSNNKRCAEHIGKLIKTSDHIFDEKCPTSDLKSIVTLCDICGSEEVDNKSKDANGWESAKNRALSFYKKEGMFQIFPRDRKLQTIESPSIVSSSPIKKRSIQLKSITIPPELSKDSSGFQVIF